MCVRVCLCKRIIFSSFFPGIHGPTVRLSHRVKKPLCFLCLSHRYLKRSALYVEADSHRKTTHRPLSLLTQSLSLSVSPHTLAISLSPSPIPLAFITNYLFLSLSLSLSTDRPNIAWWVCCCTQTPHNGRRSNLPWSVSACFFQKGEKRIWTRSFMPCLPLI